MTQKCTYDKKNKMWQITKYGITSPPFRHIRDCKYAIKLIKSIKVYTENNEVYVTFVKKEM